MTAALHALLVGIDAYEPPVPALAGCVNDITAVAEMLRVRLEPSALSLTVLTDAAATRAAVTEAFLAELGAAGPDDVALFYYSGHGSQQAAPEEFWSVEPDRRNETVVLVDSRQPGSWDLADKELGALIATVAVSGCHLLVVLDCCHSGDGTRDLDGRVRLAPDDPRTRPAASFLPGAGPGPTRSLLPAPSPAASGQHVLVAACRSDETAKEITVGGRPRGALSAALESALRETDGGPTYREVLRIVSATVQRTAREQHPRVETSDPTDLDRPFLGGAVPAEPRALTLSRLPDGWSVDAGAVHGIPEPIGADSTDLAIYGLRSATSGEPLASATVTRVLPDRSLVSVSPALDEGFVYRAVITAIPLNPMAVAVIGDAEGTASLRVAAAAADDTRIALVDDVASADLVVEARADGFVITRPGVTRPLVPVVAGDGREQRTIAALEHVARWLRLSRLRNPATRLPAHALTLDVATDAGGPAADGAVDITYAAGLAPSFTVTLRNTTDQTLWGALLDLTESYGIFTDALPAGSVCLGAGEATSVALTGQVSDGLWEAGTVTVTDHLLVVTSTLEFDPRSLEQEELAVSLPGAPAVTRSAAEPQSQHSTLDGLLTSVTTRRLGPPPPRAAVADWRTDGVLVRTTRPRD